jgi:membrane protease YdiL (CAAX protease family)
VAAAIGRGWEALGFTPNTPQKALGAVLIAAAVIAAYKALKRWVEREDDRELNLSGAPRELGLGLLAGAALFTAATGMVALLGGFEVQGLRGTGQLWSMLAIAVLSGTFEEVLFRGILFRHIETMLGSWAALAITSALFGMAHLGNPNATWFAAFAIAVEAGVMLGAAFMLTRRLWLAIGIHAAWNFTQGWVFSIPVSGGDAPLGLLITRRLGPDWLTGGEFGLEASAVALVVATLFGLFLLQRAIGQGELRPPMWKRQTNE